MRDKRPKNGFSGGEDKFKPHPGNVEKKVFYMRNTEYKSLFKE